MLSTETLRTLKIECNTVDATTVSQKVIRLLVICNIYFQHEIFSLTVSTAVHSHSEAHPTTGTPVQRNEAEEPGSDRLAEFMVDHTVWIHVSLNPLEIEKKEGFHFL